MPDWSLRTFDVCEWAGCLDAASNFVAWRVCPSRVDSQRTILLHAGLVGNAFRFQVRKTLLKIQKYYLWIMVSYIKFLFLKILLEKSELFNAKIIKN